MKRRSLLSIFLVLILIVCLASIQWDQSLIHSGGTAAMMQLLKSLMNPSLSSSILQLALESVWVTVAYAAAGISLALVIAIVLGIPASGVLAETAFGKWLSFTIFRGSLGFMRAIHELVWAWLFVAAIGLSPFTAIFALAISYGGALGKVFADLLQSVPQEPIKALVSAGASKPQILIYGYLPQAFSNMVSYSMYRFECAVRSSAIMSFVGLGGLGYQIQLSLSELRYNEVWTFLFFLIAVVSMIDLWSSQLRRKITEVSSGPAFVKLSFIAIAAVIAAAWMFVYIAENASLIEILNAKNLEHTKNFLSGLLGIGDKAPAFLNPESWRNAIRLSKETLQISIIAIGLSAAGMLLTVIPAARNAAEGSLTLKRKWYNWPLYIISRSLYIISRSVPELVWAMIIVYMLKPGVLPGALALALHNFGILGKLCAEVVEDLDIRPMRNLASSGASSWQILTYGVVPAVMPHFLNYILYRWEVIIRTTIVVGFVGAGGLGQQFKLSMSWFHYTDVTLILICYLLLVAAADLFTEGCRRIIQ